MGAPDVEQRSNRWPSPGVGKGFEELVRKQINIGGLLTTVSAGFCANGMVTRLSSMAATSTASTRKSR
jgi:hypothetical protein